MKNRHSDDQTQIQYYFTYFLENRFLSEYSQSIYFRFCYTLQNYRFQFPVRPAFNMQNQAEYKPLNYQQFINKFHQNIDDAKKTITESDRATIVLGASGEGKSILMNYLYGVKLKSIKDRTTRHLMAIQVIDQNTIISEYSHKTSSCTFSPVKVIVGDRIFYDCPGFHCSQGSLQDILNALYIEQVFKKTKNVQILLVISHKTIASRVASLVSFLKLLSSIYSSKEQIEDSLSVVVTKAQFQNQSQAKQSIRMVQEQNVQAFSQNENMRDIIKYIYNENSRLSLFKLPRKVGQLISYQEAQIILEMLNRSKTISKPNIRLPLSPETMLQLRIIFDWCLLTTKQFIPKLNNDVIRFVEEKLIRCSSFNEAIQYLQMLKQILDVFWSYRDNEGINIMEQNCQRVASAIQMSLPEQIKDCFFFIKTISQTQIIQTPQIQLQLLIRDKLTAKQFVYYILKKDEPVLNNDTLSLEGSIIGAKFIQNQFEYFSKRFIVTSVIVNCYSTLYLDKDLNLGSVKLVILAKNWVVCGEDLKKENQQLRIIKLNGQNGQPHKKTKASRLSIVQNKKLIKNGDQLRGNPGSNGIDGMQGLQGQHGGHFYGQMLKGGVEINTEKLRIEVKGGNGGIGQDGGDGSPGQDIQQQESKKWLKQVLQDHQKLNDMNKKMYLVSRKIKRIENKKLQEQEPESKTLKQQMTAILKNIVTFNGQVQEKYSIKGKCLGGKGGNGGRAGKGGNPGKAGTIQHPNLRKIQIDNLIKLDGEVGQNGKPGQKGQGGKNGKDATWVYLNEMILPIFRQGGKQFNLQANGEAQDNSKKDVIQQIVFQSFKEEFILQAFQKVFQETSLEGKFFDCKLGKLVLINTIANGIGAICATINSNWIQEPSYSDPQVERYESGSIPDEISQERLNYQDPQNVYFGKIIQKERKKVQEYSQLMRQKNWKVIT